ncbi:LysR family transcriptional regulator [Rhodococcus sp. 14-2470-1a]|uniref:LysR family transcriptional regulator n=1 Tax=Rhodococcus sp. 14-2470-1a TaxID=2023150 RepID=UPI000B9ADACA|nr:LysR family transcriptional regulator [Rhodococcus sp. 14-2470-1a]OZF50117.1 LysR family transcriptional regulator [Rhodococcus sp. 14-2470-1a]
MDDYSFDRPESVAPLLAAFDAVAAEGHVTRAAARLDVPQSSVSRRVHSLERILGLALIQPVGRGVGLTASGRELFNRTHHVMRELDDAVAAVRSDADPDSGVVGFGFPLTLGSRSVAALLTDFHAVAPRVRVRLVQAHGEALADMIRDGRLDLAVMIPPPDDLDVTVLGSQQIFVHVAATHPFASRRALAVEDLADEAFVASPPSFQLRTLLDTWCAEAGFVPRVPFEISEIDTIEALVRAGLGIALLPKPEVAVAGVTTVPLTGDRTRSVGLATGRRRPTAPVAHFHRHVTRHANQLIVRP